jgi:hypothetical protein
VQVSALGNALPAGRVVLGEGVALKDRHPVEIFGEHAPGEQAADARAHHDGVPPIEVLDWFENCLCFHPSGILAAGTMPDSEAAYTAAHASGEDQAAA